VKSSIAVRLLAVLGCLGLLVAVGGEAYRRLQFFGGELRVALNASEHVAVRPATGGRLPLQFGREENAILRSLAAASLPFEDPPTWQRVLDTSLCYDAARLPFSVQLDHVEVLKEEVASNILHLTSPQAKKRIQLTPGDTLDLDGHSFDVAAIRKWSGLLRDHRGTPMAVFSLRRPSESWTQGLFLPADRWLRIEPQIAVHLSWFDSETAARQAADAGLPGIESARWGAVDGPAVNWFQSFLPGTGATLSDGTTVTLMRLDEKHATSETVQPAIQVQIEKAGQTRAVWATANHGLADALLKFEYPSQLETVVLFCAFHDGAALAAVHHGQRLCGTKTLTAGEAWRPEGSPYELRLDQALAQAVPILAEDSPLYEAVLHSPSRTLRLRQGEAVRVDDALLQYARITQPPCVRYDLAVVEGATGEQRAVSIAPDDSVRVGAWVLSQGEPAPANAHAAVLRAERSPARTWGRVGLAVALAALIGIVLLAQQEESTEQRLG